MIQIGRGEFEPETCSTGQFTVEYYRYKESIAEDIKKASLVISHAGMIGHYKELKLLEINSSKNTKQQDQN